MGLVGILVLLLIVGVVMALVPVDAQIKRVIYVVLAVLLVLWLLYAFGLIGHYHDPGPVIIRE